MQTPRSGPDMIPQSRCENHHMNKSTLLSSTLGRTGEIDAETQVRAVINAKALAHCLQDMFDNVATRVHEIGTEDQFPELEECLRSGLE